MLRIYSSRERLRPPAQDNIVLGEPFPLKTCWSIAGHRVTVVRDRFRGDVIIAKKKKFKPTHFISEFPDCLQEPGVSSRPVLARP